MGSRKPLTITLPEEMADTISAAVADGEYASTTDVIRDALLAWTKRHARQTDERLALQADIDRGLADIAAGRTRAFDRDAIIARGRIARSVRALGD